MLAGALFAAGLMSFGVISYHLSKTKIAADQWIPVMLAISTAFGVLANLAGQEVTPAVACWIMSFARSFTALSPLGKPLRFG
jgi:hypothetical protein